MTKNFRKIIKNHVLAIKIVKTDTIIIFSLKNGFEIIKLMLLS